MAKKKTSKQSKETAERMRQVAEAAATVKVKKKHKKYVVLVALLLVVVLVLGCWFYDRSSLTISDFLYDTFYELIHPTPDVDEVEHATLAAGTGTANGELLLHFVDVGQGDCIIVQFPDGKNMIIDGGPRSAKNAVLKYIDAQGITEFEYLLLTHSDEDHCGSIDDVILHTDVKNIFWPGVSENTVKTAVYKQFLTAMRDEGATVKVSEAGMKFGSEDFGYWFYIITPEAGEADRVKANDAHSVNAISPIMFLKFGDLTVCFTGDSNDYNEPQFVEKLAALDTDGDGDAGDEDDRKFFDCDILKVAHHGSESSSAQSFLDAVRPEYAVIQAGAGNKYGHPTPQALSRLESTRNSNGREGADIYCTMDCGNIVFRLAAEDGSAKVAEITSSKALKNLNTNRAESVRAESGPVESARLAAAAEKVGNARLAAGKRGASARAEGLTGRAAEEMRAVLSCRTLGARVALAAAA